MAVPKRLPLKTFEYIYERVPRICVDLVIKSPKGVLLSLRNIPPIGYWHFPGGSILFNESPENAVQRVAKEELGVKVKIVKLLGVISFHNYIGLGHPISIAYLVKPLSPIKGPVSQASAIKYFKTPPPKTIKKQKDFFKKHLITKK